MFSNVCSVLDIDGCSHTFVLLSLVLSPVVFCCLVWHLLNNFVATNFHEINGDGEGGRGFFFHDVWYDKKERKQKSSLLFDIEI